jgi:hypothetical protein
MHTHIRLNMIKSKDTKPEATKRLQDGHRHYFGRKINIHSRANLRQFT